MLQQRLCHPCSLVSLPYLSRVQYLKSFDVPCLEIPLALRSTPLSCHVVMCLSLVYTKTNMLLIYTPGELQAGRASD